uniref:non-specific serine/threonine protein kinase n=1 Tax=Cicer arietinum TaxID=3827 RepID=A0A1S2XG11_CICAR|nr:G-type lectin S-receptor-like serine/threonine-protein kinase RLK1 isoform X1 [Cicer arietinum]
MVEPTSFLFFFTLHLSLITVVISAKFTIVNQCNYTVWPASYNTSGSAPLATTGFVLQSGENSTVTAPANWNGRFWGRTLCTTDSASGNFSCVTGDCGSGKIACGGRSGSPPVTLAEFSINSFNNQDFYDVSLVDGYNVPMDVIPLSNSGKCKSTGCPTDLNAVCPTELKVTENGIVVACQGPCAAFNLQFFCCVGNHSTPETCEPSVYAQIFKKACPQAYSYAYDDNSSTFTCAATDYQIVFCPASNNASSESLDQGGSIPVGESLTAGSGTARWLSPSGDFAFGFYQLPNELFLLAIWYDKIQTDAIIWYANGDILAPKGSRLVLNDTSGLVLTNPGGSELWKSNFPSGTISNGLMNDVGNFQLRDKNSVAIWDSFNHPSDTLVPNQVIELNGNLSSRQGEFNFSQGKFKLHLQQDGNLVLNVINLPSNYSYDPYYSSGTNSNAKNQTNVGERLIFDKSGFLYIEKKGRDNFSIINPNETFSTNDFYYKATINYDGVFTIAFYPKDPKRGQSWVIAKTIPENICLYSSFTNGEGVCGFNSICTLTNDQRPNCTCPYGYSPIDTYNMYAGCLPNFQVICQAGGNWDSQDNLYTMKELPNTDWPKSDYEIISPSSLQECKDSCLQDCLCVLVSFNQSSCWKKKLPLSYGRNDQEVKGISIMKLMNNDPLSSLPNKKKGHDTLIIVISVLLGSSVFVILTLFGAIFFGFPYNRKKIKRSITNKSVVGNNLRNFSFKEIIEATGNFREELGRGSCSIVYKGTIEMMIGVAVKKLDKLIQDSEKEFQTEMSVIGQTHHRNLVRLLGYCNEGQHRILIYELMSNGTLASFIFSHSKPNWNQRVEIALGIARGLVYLHEGCYTQIIHCDIKPQNILLDDHYNARISDFGLAKLLLINQSHTETGIRGTKGYVAPDWFRSAPITAKVDTYSFGVLLLEIICCRKNVEKEIFTDEKGILTDWAYDCYKTKRLDILLDKDIEVGNDMMSLEKFVMIVIWCIQEDPSLRPTMKDVLLMLEGIVEVVVPPSPYLYGSVSCN